MVAIDRAARKAEKAAKRNKKSIKLQTNFIENNPLKEPKVQVLPDIEKLPKFEASISTLDTPKQVRVNANGSRFGLTMTWCARKADSEGDWSWGEPRAWDDVEWTGTILNGLNNIEGLDWKEIQQQSSDSGHLMHHSHDVVDIADEAVERWINLGFEEFDEIFRFRLGNTKRAWGVVLNAHFYMVWWERKHRIYSVD
ncbi:hypothetical protein [Shewanella sp. Arc9-LZ]|uniref:hypothetical protein n=1 Tax=Shewanella sp. Arc9-LZ TaxID=2698686 RepID=UPI00137C32C6|nr:hypothetical protein [Shewanella sp. Arc9-LZ]QHS12042.1 hypothetical protein GUY17_02360 [Shewanella sp. Arc9-LZ]